MSLYGTRQRLCGEFRDFTGHLFDPSSVMLRVSWPVKVNVQSHKRVYRYALGELTRLSTGIYCLSFLVDFEGEVTFTWCSEGVGQEGKSTKVVRF